jgi:hypothetical protein
LAGVEHIRRLSFAFQHSDDHENLLDYELFRAMVRSRNENGDVAVDLAVVAAPRSRGRVKLVKVRQLRKENGVVYLQGRKAVEDLVDEWVFVFS